MDLDDLIIYFLILTLFYDIIKFNIIFMPIRRKGEQKYEKIYIFSFIVSGDVVFYSL